MFERLLSRYRGRHDWPSVTASIASATRYYDGKNAYHDEVIYTFWLAEHIYSGKYDAAAQNGTPYYLNPNDTLTIAYNPKAPNINFNPYVDLIYQYGVKPFLIGGVALLAIIIFLR